MAQKSQERISSFTEFKIKYFPKLEKENNLAQKMDDKDVGIIMAHNSLELVKKKVKFTKL